MNVPAVDHPLLDAEERLAQRRPPGRRVAVDRVQEQAGHEVDLAPEPRLREHGRQHREAQPPPGSPRGHGLARAVIGDRRPGDRQDRDGQQRQVGPDRGQPLPLRRQGQAVGDRLVEAEQDERPAEEFPGLRPIREDEPAEFLHPAGRGEQHQRPDRVGRPDDQGRRDRPRMPAGRRQAVRHEREVGEGRDRRGELAELQGLGPVAGGLEDLHRAGRAGEQADGERVLEGPRPGSGVAR